MIKWMEAEGVIRRMKHFDDISRYRQGESYRHIARELGIDRKTVKAIAYLKIRSNCWQTTKMYHKILCLQ